MFTSTNYSSNAFSCFPSSSSSSSPYPPLPFLIDPEDNAFSSDNFFLHDPLAAVPFIPTTTHDAPIIADTVTNLAVADCAANMLNQEPNGNVAHYGSISNFLTKKPSGNKNKDRHSKIHTSQGLRDGRVRLSSEIARKFFDLQEMLEYNKPSSTLEWLFNKSENAIKELVQSKRRCSNGDAKCSCFSSEPQVQGVDSKEKSLEGNAGASSKERRLKWAEKEGICCVQGKKESREKARARARAREWTSNYKRVQDLEEKIFPPATANPQTLHQLRAPIQHQACGIARWPNKLVQPYPNLVGSEFSESPRDGFNVIEESIVIKGILKPSFPSSHHQNLAIPKEASFNNNDNRSFPSFPPNWDAIGATHNGRSNFCGASMNLPTELQIFGTSWEECTNQRRH